MTEERVPPPDPDQPADPASSPEPVGTPGPAAADASELRPGPEAGRGPEPSREAHGDDRESAYELLRRGQALLRKRHNAQAAVVLARAARSEPGKASILEALGRAYFNSGQHEHARETFEALLEVDPSSHYGHFALGQSLKKLGREREAWTHLRLAVAMAPGTAIYRSALARLPDPRGGEDN